MNKIAIISDVHANEYALSAVLRDITKNKIDNIYCLGDIVGYNALPHETLKLLVEKGVPTIKGNHDMMATGELGVNHCGPNAKKAIIWTRTELVEEEIHYLKNLPGHLNPDPHLLMVHSKLGDPIGYLKTNSCYLEHYRHIRDRFPEVRVCLTGHTHVRGVIEITGASSAKEILSNKLTIDPERFYFINPGSVGHPRHSDYRASYAVFNRIKQTIHFARIRYPKKEMVLVNRNHHIQTELGPGAMRYRVELTIRRLKGLVRRHGKV